MLSCHYDTVDFKFMFMVELFVSNSAFVLSRNLR